MSWPFHCSAWEHFAGVWGAVGVLRSLHEESAAPPAGDGLGEPSEADRRSVAPRIPPKIAVPYSFTSADEAAEALVLSELAALCAGGRTSWEACVALFAGEREGGDGPSGRSGVPVAGEKPVRLHG